MLSRQPQQQKGIALQFIRKADDVRLSVSRLVLEDFAALLINSHQAPLALGDTCSGIDCAATRAKAARIVVVGHGSTEDGVGSRHKDIKDSSSYTGVLEEQKEIEFFGEEEVQLIFMEEAANGSRSLGRVEPDVKYGKLD